MLISCDIESICGIVECKGFGGSKHCSHALHHKRNRIALIGCYWEVDGDEKSIVFHTTTDFNNWLGTLLNDYHLLFHNGKWDIKSLVEKGVRIDLDRWTEDTQIAALAYSHKIPSDWLDEYEARRKIANKRAGANIHRTAREYSLKTLAPYFAGTEEFWETESHNNDEYVIKDAKYTYKLYKALMVGLAQDGTETFYRNKLMPWSKLLLGMEQRGVSIDLPMLAEMEAQTKLEIKDLKSSLDMVWAPAYEVYYDLQRKKLHQQYQEKFKAQQHKVLQKAKTEAEGLLKVAKLAAKYQIMEEKAALKLSKEINLDSPAQLYWLLKEYLQLNIRDPDGEETTGKAVLENLIMEGHEDIKMFSEYKKKQKLLSSFFEAYKEANIDGVLYCGYNLSGTRTGRLSSNSPNLQQVAGSLHCIFKARPGYKLATFDESSIEPRLIAFYTEDLTLCKIYTDELDFHNVVTKEIFEHVNCDVADVKKKFKKERDCAKAVDLSLFYGSGVNRLKHTTVKHGFSWDEKMCRYKLEVFKKKFQQVFKFKNEELDPILINGAVTNLMGRKFRIEDATQIYMTGFNTLIQSSGSDIVINSAYLINKEFREKGIDGHILMAVHDELVSEIPIDREEECREIIIRNMTNYHLTTQHGVIPLIVEGTIAHTWEK